MFVFPMVLVGGLMALLDTKSLLPDHLKSKAHPGYREQWFNEKKDVNGEIPAFLRSKWAQYDCAHPSERVYL